MGCLIVVDSVGLHSRDLRFDLEGACAECVVLDEVEFAIVLSDNELICLVIDG